MELTVKEKELIEIIRLFRKAKHNPSKQLYFFVRELFETLLDEDESEN